MRLLCIISLIILTAVNAPVVIAQETGSGQQEDQENADPPQDRRQRRQDGQPRRQTPDGETSDGRTRGERQAERRPSDGTPRNEGRFRERMVVLEIGTRLMGQNETVIWNETHLKETLLGRPVGIKLVGNNVIVDVQFTPYFRPGTRYFLVAQSQIWMEIPNEGVRYYTTMQTIPVEFGELVYFFPLGPGSDEDDSLIEVTLTVQPYEEN